MRVLIIGGGAAGMMAAITAARNGHTVTLAERQARLGRKLSATGSGRCNLSNRHAAPAHYHSEAPEILAALSRFGVEDTLAFFRGLGLLTTEEPDGKLYPWSDQAGSVVDVLRFAVEQSGVTVKSGCEVTGLTRSGSRFWAQTSAGRILADAVIVAAGGPAGGKLGGTDLGIRLLTGLGHSATALHPGLVQMTSDEPALRSLKGVRATAALRLQAGAECLTNYGEVQFTELGVSGPAAFELSRGAALSAPCVLELDLLPQLEPPDLLALLEARCDACGDFTLENLLTGTLHNRLGRALIRACGLNLNTPLRQAGATELTAIAALVKGWAVPITGTLGFDQCQVTIGGVRAGEFDPDTLESRLVPNLYACGEVLDVDGDCGGYNLQWAWASGHVAGQLGHGEGCQ